MAIEQFFDSGEDVEWLFTTHLDPDKFKSFIIRGNEDAPTSVDLFTTAHPLITDIPDVVVKFNN